MGRWNLLFHLILIFLTSSSAAAASISKPGCPDKCGNISIPYPFGIKDGCFRDDQDGFQLFCDDTYHPPKLFLGANYEVLELSLEGEAMVSAYVASHCYEQSQISQYSSMQFSESGPFTFSNTRNKFTAIGPNTQAYLTAHSGDDYVSGCISFWWEMTESVETMPCSGFGCCQTTIPSGVKWFQIDVYRDNRIIHVQDLDACSYAFLIQEDQFQFNITDLTDTSRYSADSQVPVGIDWAIGNQMWESALKNLTSYACKSMNSACYNSTNGPAYRCKCSDGFQGNPYLEEGCKDINECIEKTDNCNAGICHNTEGSFTCSCPKGQQGDGINVCMPNPMLAQVILGVGLGFLFVLIAGSWAYWGFQKRKLIKLKQKYFQQNGGLLLQQRITSNEGATTIFTVEDLERATNKFNELRIIGRGGFGIVYKGILPNHGVVAIKKSKIVDERQIEQFINEVFILSRINHRNIVKLLGCCLETQVPLLVYEFISNGTLFHHIHDKAKSSLLSLEIRLRIASETAGALAYLHFATSVPIFHRDVKSTNILLDDNLTAKVSDFGASRLVPLDKNQVTTLVQGTFGYLDPEYFHRGQLTEKSDVYSFGVVLVEILTGQKPICSSRSQEERSLPMLFTSAMRENHLFQVLDNRIVSEDDVEQLKAVAQLAMRCLSVKGEERPTMKEVALELDALRRIVEHRWAQRKCEQTHSLLSELSNGNNGSGIAAGVGSLNNFSMSSIQIGR